MMGETVANLSQASATSRQYMVKLKDVAKISSGTTPLRSEARFHLNGTVPWVKTTDLNNGEILDTEERVTDFALKETSLKIFPRGTVLVAMYGGFNQIGRTGILGIDATINQALSALVVHEDETDPKYLLHWLNGNVGLWKSFAGSSRKDPNITSKDVGDFPFLKIPFDQQKFISSVLDTTDSALIKMQLLIAKKELQKKGLMQRLLWGKKRLRGFSKKWQTMRISDIAEEISNRNLNGSSITVLSCTKYHGLVPSLEYFGRKVFGDDLNLYKVVPKNHFAYATNHIEEGSIGYQDKLESGLISPMYTVFRTTRPFNDRYLFALLKTESYVQEYKRRMEGSIDRRGGLRWDEFSKIKISFPTVSEQDAVVSVFQIADQEITLLKAKLDKLREQKKGLMYLLLTGKKRLKEFRE